MEAHARAGRQEPPLEAAHGEWASDAREVRRALEWGNGLIANGLACETAEDRAAIERWYPEWRNCAVDGESVGR